MLMELPAVFVDLMLLRYLTADDLRAVHQVSTGWRNLLNSRSFVTQKRMARVHAIRNDKENVVPYQKGGRLSGSGRSHSRSSSTDSGLNTRTYRLKKCKPFRELNSNTPTSDDNNNINSSVNSTNTPSPAVVVVDLNGNLHHDLQQSKHTITISQIAHTNASDSSDSNCSPMSPTKAKALLLNGLGNVKRKGKSSLRRIANI